jgi:L-threonylcarbamoyladenylate synthase
MTTEILTDKQINIAAQIIKRGGLVAFPTETVYGLGGDATNIRAIVKIFEVKGRPTQNPLIVHFASLDDLFARIPDIDANTKRVLTEFSDALTVVIPRPKWIPPIVSAGLDTVAVRVPSCEFARKFISACGTPLAAPSANTSTRPSPTNYRHVAQDLDGKIDAIFKYDQSRIGVESTVVQVVDGCINVLRLGGTSTAQLSKIMPTKILAGTQTHASPGTQFKHYAPACKMVVAKYSDDQTDRIKKYIANTKTATVVFWQGSATDYLPNVVYLGDNVDDITRNFYHSIRSAEWGSEVIVFQGFPNTPEFETLNERLHKATDGNYI